MPRGPYLIALPLALASLLAGSACGEPGVPVDPPRAEGDSRTTKICRSMISALPSSIDASERRTVSPSDAPAAAWGDPAIVLRCGVARPAALKPTSVCTEINGVGWLAEKAERGHVFTTIGREAYVEVAVPSDYAPEPMVLVDLAPAVKKHDPSHSPCL